MPLPHYQCCLQVFKTVSRRKLPCCHSSNMLQHLVEGRGLIYFCKVEQSRISRNFFRNWFGLKNLCEILWLLCMLFLFQTFKNSFPFFAIARMKPSHSFRLYCLSPCNCFISQKHTNIELAYIFYYLLIKFCSCYPLLIKLLKSSPCKGPL